MLAKKYHFQWVAGGANNLSKYITYIFFNFGRDFYGSFLMLFPKAPASCYKKMSSKIVPQIFKIFFQTGHVNIFVRRGVIFSRYVQR